jgi:hypothetical protein
MSSSQTKSATDARRTRRTSLEWGLVLLACLFQLASAQTTFAGAEEFLTHSFTLAAILTFVIQAGLVFSGERLVEILSGRQQKRTSLVPALLLLALTLSTSVLFSGFGFYKHYAYQEGNRAAEFTSTSIEIKQAAEDLEKFRAESLGFVGSKSRALQEDRRRQESRANNVRLPTRARGVARLKKDQLNRDIANLDHAQATLENVNVIASATQSTPDMMRQSLIGSRNKITEAISAVTPDYLSEHPLPGEIPTIPPPTDVQSGFGRDLRLRRTPALFSLGIAGVIDLASLLCLLSNIYVCSTEERILSSKRKIKRTWKAILPVTDTHDTFSAIRMRVEGRNDGYEFRVVFQKPDWALCGSDLEANRSGVEDALRQNVDANIRVNSFVSPNGQAIIPEQPLMSQLGNTGVVHVRIDEAERSRVAAGVFR